MTVLALRRLSEPADFAPWFEQGAAYVERVASAVGTIGEYGDRRADATAALSANDRRPDERTARTIVPVFVGDADWLPAYHTYMPEWYGAVMDALIGHIEAKLDRVGRRYARAAPAVEYARPTYHRAGDVRIGGRPAVADLDTLRERFWLADAILHIDWFEHAVRHSPGVEGPAPEFFERAREESAAYFAGRTRELSADVRTFQRWLFTDIDWVRAIDAAYGLNSWVLAVWARWLEGAYERLAPATASPTIGQGDTEPMAAVRERVSIGPGYTYPPPHER